MIVINDAELLEFRALVAQRLGLWFDEHRREFLAGLLRERVEADGPATGDVSLYLQRLTRMEHPGEWPALVTALTVTETYFFRGQEHLQVAVDTVLAKMRQWTGGVRRLRLLSAGCASGEEACSLAILLHEQVPSFAGWQIEIIGIDANRDMLAKARRGRYSAWSLRETPPEMREKYFHATGQEFVLAPQILAMVTFEERNLVAPDPDFWAPASFDAVFCRNVLMYFTPGAATAVVGRIEHALAPGGFLFLGHAETLRGLSQAFHLRRSHGAFYYRLRNAADAPADDTVGQAGWTGAASTPPPAAPAEPTAPSPAWFDVIGRASARIASLSMPPPPAPPVQTASTEIGPSRMKTGVIDRVLALHRQERFTEALAQLQGMPTPAAGDADWQVLQAVLLVNCGRLGDAEELCRPLLGRDDLNAGAHYLVALCREHAGELAAAEEHDAMASHLDPLFAMPRFHLGLICKRLDRVPEALIHFQDASGLLLKEDPVRLLLFGGGFSRETLLEACRSEIRRLGGIPIL